MTNNEEQAVTAATPLLSPSPSASAATRQLPFSADSPASLASDTPRTYAGKIAMEVLGTGMLVLTIQLCLGSGSKQAALGIAFALSGLIFAGAPVSGAHYNPAVTLAFILRGRVAARAALWYVPAEIAGGVLGGLLGAAIGGSTEAFHVGAGHTLAQAALAELVFTTLLCFTILATVTHEKGWHNPMFGLTIAAVVYGAAIAVGPVSGAGLNPAVVIGLAFAQPENDDLMFVAASCLAEMLGGFVGVLAFWVVAPEQFAYFNTGARSFFNSAAVRTAVKDEVNLEIPRGNADNRSNEVRIEFE